MSQLLNACQNYGFSSTLATHMWLLFQSNVVKRATFDTKSEITNKAKNLLICWNVIKLPAYTCTSYFLYLVLIYWKLQNELYETIWHEMFTQYQDLNKRNGNIPNCLPFVNFLRTANLTVGLITKTQLFSIAFSYFHLDQYTILIGIIFE